MLKQTTLCDIRSGGARRRRRRRPPTASRLKGPRKQKSFAYKLLKRGLENLMSPTSTSGVAPPLDIPRNDARATFVSNTYANFVCLYISSQRAYGKRRVMNTPLRSDEAPSWTKALNGCSIRSD
ncbi:hypothetical protein EVAR_27277_1 [Eumeta japonica]|uniref:Uncharacterized protein n=1 Tax=Eumeta variegata TaxID=151549 RepID=A0A4C1W1E9_EUMVA|nr:hypothetical protein EVAR_27277_1 [Eumeta japonica]